MNNSLIIAGRQFRSRLILGSGKYASFELMVKALEASGTDMVTVAVRRVNLTDRAKESFLDHIDSKKYHILPNTAGCYSADEAIRTAMLAREVLDNNWIKLEVIGDERTLFPDNQGLLEATRELVKEGFVVLPYFNDDLIVARRLIDAGAAAVMPLAAPIGSGLGIQNFTNLRILREQIREVPLIVDAGVGTASVAAAVNFNIMNVPKGRNDSKQLTKLQREQLAEAIQRSALAFSISRVEHQEIDQINILKASLQAMELAVQALRPYPDYVLIDGR